MTDSLTTFSFKDKQLQIEHILNAVAKGNTAIGIKAKNGVVLVVEKQNEFDQMKYEEKQKNVQNYQVLKKQDQQKHNLKRQPSQKSSQKDGKQNECKSQLKSKAVEQQQIDKDYDLLVKELEGLINNFNNAIDKFPSQGGKEKQFSQLLPSIEDYESDEDEPTNQFEKKTNDVLKQISKEEEERLNKQDQKPSTLKMKLENALGVEKMNKAKNILKQTLEKLDLESIEKEYGPNFEKLLPFLTLEERKKYAPLLFTYIIAE